MLKLTLDVCVHVQLCLTLCNSTDCTCQAPLSMEFSRQEYWWGLPFPSPWDLPDPGFKPESPALTGNSLPAEPLGNIPFHIEHTGKQSDIWKRPNWGCLATGTRLLCWWECRLIQAIQRGNLALLCEIKDACFLRFRTSSFYPRKNSHTGCEKTRMRIFITVLLLRVVES